MTPADVRGFLGRHATEIKVTVVAFVAAAAAWAIFGRELGIGLFAAVAIGIALSLAYTEGGFRERERTRVLAEREQAQREREELAVIAELARTILCERDLWRDVVEWNAWSDTQHFNPSRAVPRPPSWTVISIVASLREDLDPGAVGGWGDIADAIRGSGDALATAMQQRFPGAVTGSRAELREIYDLVANAVAAADQLNGSYGQTQEERRAGLRAFRAALAQLVESIRRIEATGVLAKKVEAAQARAAETARERRELQSIAATAAEELLRAASPAADHLARSSVRLREGTLREVAAAEKPFAFAPDDEEAGLDTWRTRIGSAQRGFQDAVLGRGLEMHGNTHTAWVFTNDGLRELDNALIRLQGDRRARTLATGAILEGVQNNITIAREQIQEAVRRLVTRIEELRQLEVT